MSDWSVPAAESGSNPEASAASFRRNRVRLYAGAAASVFIVIVTAWAALLHTRDDAEAHAGMMTQGLARSMELSLEGMISTIDLALQGSADEIARQIASGKVDAASLTRFLERQKNRLPQVAYLRGVNERGEMRYGVDGAAPPVNIADRDYFIELRDRPPPGLLMVKPLKGRLTPEWLWLLARRVDKRDGSFGGVVLAVLKISEIERLLAQVPMDPGGSVALRDADYALVARVVAGAANTIPIGDARLSRPFRDALKANPVFGTYLSDATSVDEVARIYSYRRDARHGFTVNVGMAHDSALETWWDQAWFVAWMLGAFLAITLAYVLLIGRAWRRQEQDLAAMDFGRQVLREHDSRYRSVVEASSDGFWVIDGEGRIRDVNEAYAHRSGYAREELLNMRISDLEANETQVDTALRIQAILRKGSEVFESRHRTKDGRIWPVEVSARLRIDYPDQILAFLRDITGRKRDEAMLRTRLRFSELAQAGSMDALLQYALDAAEEVTGSRIAFFHFVDPDQENLTLQAWSSNTLAHMCKAEGKGQHYPISQAGVWVEAFHTRAPVIHNDYASLAQKKGLPEGHAPVVRELVVPILRDGKVIELIGVGNKASDYVEADVRALQMIVDMIRDFVDRSRAEEKLRTLSRAMEQSPASVIITDPAGNIEYVNPRFEETSGYTRAEVVGRHPRMLRSGAISDEVYAQMWATISAGDEWRGELCNRHKNGELYWEFAAISGLEDESGKINHYIAVKEDITERKAVEAKNIRLTNLYAALSECSQAVVRCTGEQELYREVCRALVEFGGMKMAWVSRVDAASGRVIPVAAYGLHTDYLEGIDISVNPDLPSGRGPTGCAIRENLPYWCEDFLRDPVTAHWHERSRTAGWRGSAALPICRNGVVVGALTLYSMEVNAFDDAARSLVSEIVANINFALGKFDLEGERRRAEASARVANEQLRKLTVRLNTMHEKESRVLSRELHDEFGQLLSSLKMDLSWIASRLGRESGELRSKVASSIGLVDASVRSIHSIAARLRPRILDELGLLPAIDWLVQDFRERSGLDAEFVANARVPGLTPEQATVVFRIVQESLSNVARHAGAKCVDVSVDREGDWVLVEVRDDGRGIAAREVVGYESIGLLGMRERALAAEGELDIQSVLGKGTVVTLKLPYPRGLGEGES